MVGHSKALNGNPFTPQVFYNWAKKLRQVHPDAKAAKGPFPRVDINSYEVHLFAPLSDGGQSATWCQ